MRRTKNAINVILILCLAVTIITCSVIVFFDEVRQEYELKVKKYSLVVVASEEYSTPGKTGSAGLRKPLNGVGFTLYALTLPTLSNEEAYLGTYFIYEDNSRVVVNTTLGTAVATATAVGEEKMTAGQGEVIFSGLEQGQYLLVETTVPAGYQYSPQKVVSLTSGKQESMTELDASKGMGAEVKNTAFFGFPYKKESGSDSYFVYWKAFSGMKEAADDMSFQSDRDIKALGKEVTVVYYTNGTIDSLNPQFSLPLIDGVQRVFFSVIGLLLMVTAICISVFYRRVYKVEETGNHKDNKILK